ncbi:MAG: nucleotidyl transferase AbiEii/AbiGii toxin family protein [Planctomycetes bacterium]|nr:nucleotidyl transferase AbiEii/AbiGii toxin family protein [Planctomycetota bacterium]
MKTGLSPYLDLSAARRKTVCEEAGAQLGLAAASIEKDYWICWTLRELFELDDHGAKLTFKGGTSLSKGWKLIDRFSEDIDIVVSRTALGFGGGDAPDAVGISNKERERRLERLGGACGSFVQNELKSALRERVGERLAGRGNWKLENDAADPAGQTLLLQYPSEFETGPYVRPLVKIELGARSDTEPIEQPDITTYLADALPILLPDSAFSIRTVAPERTFWEKAMLLHEEAQRGTTAPPAPRLSRHYYDVWCLITKGVAERAEHDTELFERIAAHRAVFFKKNRAAQESLRRGRLKLLPRLEHMAVWKRDYESMREAMFFGTPPEFDSILAVVRDFETRFNAGGG